MFIKDRRETPRDSEQFLFMFVEEIRSLEVISVINMPADLLTYQTRDNEL